MDRKKLIIRAAAAVALLILCMIAFDVRLKTMEYTVDAPQIESRVRIALVTDLHSCSYGREQRTLIDAIDAQAPDMVMLGGDIFDDVMDNENSRLFVGEIAARYQCFYVTGNHEYWSYEAESFVDYISSCGVTVLRGDCVPVEINGQMINICGIDDPDGWEYGNPPLSLHQQLTAANGAADNGNYTVLLSHRPELTELYQQYDFDLILSGHAHGGQWRIPLLLNGLIAPGQGLFPEYAGGCYDIGDTLLIVSRGLARESTRVPRIFNRPELVIVDVI